MKTMLALAVVGLAFGLAAAELSAQTGDQDLGRVPNLDTQQRFPRWLPPVRVDPDPATIGSSYVFGPSGALDSRGIVHGVGIKQDQTTLYWYSSEFGGFTARGANGFCARQTIATATGSDAIFETDIATGVPTGTPLVDYRFVVFSESASNNFENLYRVKWSSSGWSSKLNFTNSGNLEFYGQPAVILDGSNTAQIVALHSVYPSVTEFVYITVTSADVVTIQSIPNSTYSMSASNPRIALGSDGSVHVTFTKDQGFYYNKLSGGTWTQTQISPTGQRGGLAVDANDGNAVHLTWVDVNDQKVRYRKGTAGTTELVSTGMFGASSQYAYAQVAVDGQKQPHVAWESTSGTLGYAARLNRTDLGGDPWVGRQEPVDFSELGNTPAIGPSKLLMSPNGVLHIIGNSYYDMLYTRMIEHNLGEQDPYTMLPIGPNARSNAVNGNLLLGIPLFSAKGAGISTSFSLIYNSQEPSPGSITQGWSHNYNMYVVDSQIGVNTDSGTRADLITLFFGDGRSIVFEYQLTSDGNFHLARDEFGYFGKIERVTAALTTQYRLTTKFGMIYLFNTDGKLGTIQDQNQNTLQLNYNSQGQLYQILDTMATYGRPTTTITYTSLAYPTIDTITDPGGKTYKFGYETTDLKEQLQTVTLNNGGISSEKPVWTFAYYGADNGATHARINLISGVTTPRGNQEQYFYYLDNRCQGSLDPSVSPASVDETDPGAKTIAQAPQQTLNYNDPATPGSPPADEPRVEWTNRRNFLWKTVFQQRRSLATKTVDPLGKFVQRTFDGTNRNLKTYQDKETNSTTYLYTQESGTKETPLYVKDNLRSVTSPSANAPSGNIGATIVTSQYTYYNGFSRVNTLVTPNPASPGSTVTTTYTYDSNWNLSSTMYPATSNRVDNTNQTVVDQIIYVSSAPLGRIDHTIAPEGGTTQYAYDTTTGLPNSITRPARSKAEQLTYDVMGNMLTDQLPENAGNPTTYNLDGLYRVHQIVQPPGDAGVATTTLNYDLDSNVTEIDYPNGGKTTNTIDSLGRKVQVDVLETAGTTLSTKLNFDPEHNLRLITDPAGNLSSKLYDSRNDLLKDHQAAAPSPDIIAILTRTDNGPVKTMQVGSDTTTYGYTARQSLQTTTYPTAGGGTAIDNETYDDSGNHLKSTRTFGGTFKFGMTRQFDEISRPYGMVQMTADPPAPTDPTTLIGYDKDGNRKQTKDPNSRIFQTSFDVGDRPTTMVNAEGTTISQSIYDDNDRVKEVDVLNPQTGSGLVISQTMTYNFRNELKTQKDILNNQTTYGYLIAGEVDTVTDPDNVVTKYQYNLLSQKTQVTQNYGGSPTIVTQFGYTDNNFNVTSVTDGRGKVYSYLYDAAHHLTQLTYPIATNKETWTYDAKGRLATYTDHRGVVGTYTYDAMDRVTGEIYKLGTTTQANLLRSYDGASNLTETLDTVSKVSHRNVKSDGTPGFDALNRLTDSRILFSVTALGGSGTLWKSVNYAYNADSTRNTFTNSEGTVFTYGYDAEGRTKTITSSKTYVTYVYDGAGRPTMTTLGNGSTIARTYDSKGRVANITAKNSGGTTLASFSYTLYSPRDERQTIVYDHLGTTLSVGYDFFGRVTSEGWSGGSVGAYSASWLYDGGGNRTQKTVGSTVTTYNYDDESRLTSQVTGSTTTTYDYTYNGTAGKSPDVQKITTGNVVQTLTYDFAHRLASYLKKTGSTTNTNYTYAYLPTGGRLDKVNKKSTSNNEEWYFPDLDDVTADYTKTTGKTTYTLGSTYVNGPGIDSKATRIQASGTELYYLSDALGSTHKVIDQTQTVKDTFLTTVWGEPHPGFTDMVNIADRYRFTQRELDTESGFISMRARTYMPSTGRFLENEPILGRMPFSQYIYAGNNPVSRIDPIGLQDQGRDEHLKSQDNLFRLAELGHAIGELRVLHAALESRKYNLGEMTDQGGYMPGFAALGRMRPAYQKSDGDVALAKELDIRLIKVTAAIHSLEDELNERALFEYKTTTGTFTRALWWLGFAKISGAIVNWNPEAQRTMDTGERWLLGTSGTVESFSWVTLAGSGLKLGKLATSRLGLASGASKASAAPIPYGSVREYQQAWGRLAAVERADALQAALPAGSQGRVTMAAGYHFDAQGQVRIVVASSEPGRYLRPSVGAAKYSWEKVATGVGDAETKLFSDFFVEGAAAGRPVCRPCQTLLDDAWIEVLSGRK
jgi:RHS repeat-associated protein